MRPRRSGCFRGNCCGPDIHRHLGLLIDPNTCVGKWDGYGVDYALCVDVLLGIDRHPWQYAGSVN
jgi:hypothetical protein